MFEFNKIITLYTFTILIVAAWTYNSITQKKFIFRRTILDIPIFIYLGIFIASTFFSIDLRTSILGYYSRFNGGLISQLAYALLYWAYVSNIKAHEMYKSLLSILSGTFVAAILAILERNGVFITCGLMSYGYSNSCWVQDVQNRVFSTLGQPNWLAALLVAVIPVNMHFLIQNTNKVEGSKRSLVPLSGFLLFLTFGALVLALNYTRSRSGILAFGTSFLLFWLVNLAETKHRHLKLFLISLALTSIIFLPNYLVNNTASQSKTTASGTVLENGGTDSGTIRKYVWIGAINIFKHYPILGSGPETFAFTFPKFKPVEHNMTSEWDFIYNKAHNEYLNYLSTMGLLGFISYLTIIVASLIQIVRSKDKLNKVTFLASYVGILITNFFGFSVVAISLLFFLLPALSIIGDTNNILEYNINVKSKFQKIWLVVLSISVFLTLIQIYRYWKSDIYYNNAKIESRKENYEKAKVEIEKAIDISPKEPVFLSESALIYSEISLNEAQLENESSSKAAANIAINNADSAIVLSPENVSYQKILSSIYYKFSIFSSEYLILAEDPLKKASQLSPFDPKTHYQIGILSLKNNNIDQGLSSLQKAVVLKPNYKEGRFALSLTHIDLKQYKEAVDNLEYILNHIDPNDDLTKKYLMEAKSALK